MLFLKVTQLLKDTLLGIVTVRMDQMVINGISVAM